MRSNAGDYPAVQALARATGAGFVRDPTITPHLNGDRSLLALNVWAEELRGVLSDPPLVGDIGEFCTSPSHPDDSLFDALPCSAEATAPAIFRPMATSNRACSFRWPVATCAGRASALFGVSPRNWRTYAKYVSAICRSVRLAYTRGRAPVAPGLAFMEGNFRGPSSADCDKSYARTGIPTAAMRSHSCPA